VSADTRRLPFSSFSARELRPTRLIENGDAAIPHIASNRRCYRMGARLVDVLKGAERRVRQSWFGSGNSAKLHYTFFVGDQGHCINYFL
jgi:hypothetical protein